MDIIFKDNSTVIEIPALQRGSDDQHIADASVTLTLRNTDDTEIAGESWPISMGLVDGSRSTYRVTLDHTLMLPNRVVVHVVVDAGPGLHAEWRKIFNVKERR